MRAATLFAALVGCQALHSIEEAAFGLYRLLPYIYWADGVVTNGAFVFFVALNAAFIAFGVWCYLARVRVGAANAGVFVYVWALVEILNGTLHPAWSIVAGRYIPGTATAPFLLVLALTLLWAWTVVTPTDPSGKTESRRGAP